MEIKAFKAGKGDSFLLCWGTANDYHLLLDGGIPGTYRFIKQKLNQINKLDALIVTHVDYDHIGGIIKFLEDSKRPVALNFPIYVNNPQLIIGNNQSEKVGYSHGIKMDELMTGLEVKPSMMNTDSGVIIINGLNLTILSPHINVLEMLVKEWTAQRIKEEYQKNQNRVKVKVTSNEHVELKSIDTILLEKEKVHNWKNDLINSSSIAFIAECDSKSILFLGDSNPDLVLDEFDKLKITEANPKEFDLIKISHHGSSHNTTKELLKRIKANKFLFSTDGTGASYHPHRDTLIKICEFARKKDKTSTRKFLFNYKLNFKNLMTDTERKKYDIDFELIDEFKI